MSHNWWSQINQRKLETLLLNAPQVFVDLLAWQSDLKGERWRSDPMAQEEIELMGRGWIDASQQGWDLMRKFLKGQTTEAEVITLKKLCDLEWQRRFLRQNIAIYCEGFVQQFEKKLFLRRVMPLPSDTDVSALYTKTATDLRSRYGGVYQCHHQGEVIIFSSTRGIPMGRELWQMHLLSGQESSKVLIMEQEFLWYEMDVKGRIDVDCHQDCRLLKVIVASDRMKDMLSTTRIEIFIEKPGE